MLKSREPSNLVDTCAVLKAGRNSPMRGQTEFAAFCSDVEISGNEIYVGVAVFAILKPCFPLYKGALNQPFTKFPLKGRFIDGLSVAKPDLVEGWFVPTFEPYHFERPLGDSAMLTRWESSNAMSHLTGEYKRVGGDFDAANIRQLTASHVYARN